jgi:hypothetical protein
MRLLPSCLAALLLASVAPARAQDSRAASSAETTDRRCAPDGETCITEASYAADVCRVVEEAAEAQGLDVNFFARLLWRESLFDAAAVSPAGAQGIAQFMPGTARLRGLADPFNPAEAILVSAAYLKELEERFGNLGLAAVAYNAGEERAARFLAGNPFLPAETRAYVAAITGHQAEAWLDDPAPAPELTLDPGLPFRDACLARAEGRGFAEPEPAEPVLLPWGVIIAAQGSREAAERQAAGFASAHGGILGGEQIVHVRARVPGMAQARHVAQVGRDTREEAESLCDRLRAEGGACMVLRN